MADPALIGGYIEGSDVPIFIIPGRVHLTTEQPRRHLSAFLASLTSPTDEAALRLPPSVDDDDA